MAQKEIGWHTVTKIDNSASREWLAGAPAPFDLLLWHHDEFSIPARASPLYESRFCANQAFVIDNMLATVAHIEVTEHLLRTWLDYYGHDVAPVSERVQPVARLRERAGERVTNPLYARWLERVLDREGSSE